MYGTDGIVIVIVTRIKLNIQETRVIRAAELVSSYFFFLKKKNEIK